MAGIKSALIDIMTLMMPFMKPLVWLALLSFIAALGLAFAGGGLRRQWAPRAARLTLGIGIFFLAAQGMGALLGAQPSINFGDPRKFEFILVPFWQLGIACIAGWLIVRGLLHVLGGTAARA
jgi:hypothetical protein